MSMKFLNDYWTRPSGSITKALMSKIWPIMAILHYRKYIFNSFWPRVDFQAKKIFLIQFSIFILDILLKLWFVTKIFFYPIFRGSSLTFILSDLVGGVDPNAFYRYRGSLTTPECNEVVRWTVFKDTIKINKRFVSTFWCFWSDYQIFCQDFQEKLFFYWP